MRSIRCILVVLGLIVACAAVAAGPANAADGRLYAYEDSWFSGDYCWWTLDNDDWTYAEWAIPHAGTCTNWGASFNDTASSLANHGYPGVDEDVMLYRDINDSGPWLCLRNGEQWADLSLGYERFSDGSYANDQISSHRWTNC